MFVASAVGVLVVGFLLTVLLFALLLKVVAGSILGHPVRYGSAVLSIFAAILAQFVAGIVMYEAGMIDPQTILAIERDPASVDAFMPLGVVPFFIATASLAAGLAVAIRYLIRGPDRQIPSWTNAALAAIAMTTLMVALQYGLSRGAFTG